MPGMPAEYFLGVAALYPVGLSSLHCIENVKMACLAAHCYVFAVAAERHSFVGGV